MKIALIDPSLFTWPYDRELAGALRAAGHDAVIFGKALPPGDRRQMDSTLRQHFYGSLAAVPEAVPRAVVRALKGFSHAGGLRRLASELGRWAPDVIHFQWLPLPAMDRVALPWLQTIAPLVLTVHDTLPFNGAPASSLQSFGALGAMARFDHLIVHTDQGRRRVLPYAAAGVSRIAHGLLHDGPHGPPTGESRAAGERVLLMFGQIKPYKGVDVLIRAVADLPAIIRARCRVRVVGKPYMDTAPLIALAHHLGVADRVEFRFDFVPDEELARLFAEAAAVVFPYREIEASGVLMAAIAHAKPVIASRLGAFAELLEDGRHGFLVPPDDPEALAGAIARLVSDPALQRDLTEGMAQLKAAIPSWAVIAEQTVAAYGLAARSWRARAARSVRLRA
jgi:glycosyltransferase involved in cell wall biosynthesis